GKGGFAVSLRLDGTAVEVVQLARITAVGDPLADGRDDRLKAAPGQIDAVWNAQLPCTARAGRLGCFEHLEPPIEHLELRVEHVDLVTQALDLIAEILLPSVRAVVRLFV